MECNVAKTWSRVVAAVLWTCLAVLIGWAIGARFGEAFAAPPKEAQQSIKSSTAVPSIAVLFDTGNGVPVGPLLTQLVGSKDAEAVSPVFQFPIEGQGLIPGELSEDAERRWPGAKWLVQPIYLVGNDPASERWLRLNAQRLGALGATGLLVQVRDAREFRRLEGVAEPTPLVPNSSPWLASKLLEIGAGVLPLLVLPDGRITQAVPAQPGATAMQEGSAR